MKKHIFFIFAALVLGFPLGCSDIPPQDDENPPNSASPSTTYLGYGYDVINSSFINRGDVKISHPVLDQQRMAKDAMLASEAASKENFEMFVGNSIKQFYQDRNAGITVGVNTPDSWAFFSGKFRSEFSVSSSESKTATNYYLRVRSYRYIQDNYIKNANAENLSNYLSENFIEALQTKGAAQILDQFGSHVLARYYKGGALEANYTYSGTKLATSTELKGALQASFYGFSGSVNASNSTNRSELEENSLFKYYAYGGQAIGSTSLAQLMEEYKNWLNSIETNADICGIDDFGQSLIPIWELAKANGSSALATALENEFNARAIRQGKAFLVKNSKIETKEFRTSGSYSFSKATKDLPAEIEIYALGGGGGGQGGDNNDGLINNRRGTGGAGGGGGAAYVKLLVEEAVSLSITVGTGGAGGNAITTGGGGTNTSGCDGKNGVNSTVSWSAKSITLTAGGGKGGNGNSSCKEGGGTGVSGGAGGTGYINPTESTYYKNKDFANGDSGTNGNYDNVNIASRGGKAAKIGDFGGEPGGWRPAGAASSAVQGPGLGGGGSGGSVYNNSAYKGANGLDGLVLIKVTYWEEE